MRQLQRIKEDNSFCSDQLDKGMYLLYSKENRNLYFLPLFVWINYTNLFELSLEISTSRKLPLKVHAYRIPTKLCMVLYNAHNVLDI